MKCLQSINMNIKRLSIILVALHYAALLTAQRQYDYYDDNAVAGGAERVLNGIIIMVLLVIGLFVVLLLGNGYYKIKYWFYPEESPEYKAAQKKEKAEEQRLKEENKEVERQVVIQTEKEKEKKAIDLGLSVLWADSNLYDDIDMGKGAKFSWGDIGKRTFFRYIDAKLNKKSEYDLKKILGKDDMSICGNEKYDAAKNLWGDNWRLPQKHEIDELIECCDWEWTIINSISGYKVIGKNGNFIFLPITGESVADKSDFPLSGFYWSGSANNDILGEESHFLYFDESQKVQKSDGKRWHGMAIRPVWSPNNEIVEKDGFTMSLYGTKLIKCNDIEECHIPYGVKIIAKGAFKDAKNVKNLYIPNSVEEIEEYAFSCLPIESVNIPKSINKWGEGAFSCCAELKNVIIEDGLPRLGLSMFAHCNKIKSINIPDSVTNLPDRIFNYCKNLESISIPANLNNIGDSAFYACENLKSIVIPKSVIGIQDDTFGYCENLTNVTISEGVIALSSHCFEACIRIRNLRIPATLQHIDTNCFGGSCYITLEVPKGMASYYRNLEIEGVVDFKEYDTRMPDNIEELKEKCEAFISFQKYKREQKEYEFEKDMGIMTRKDYEEDFLMDMTDTINDY